MTWRPARWSDPPADATTDDEKLAAIVALVDDELGNYLSPETVNVLSKILDILTDA